MRRPPGPQAARLRRSPGGRPNYIDEVGIDDAEVSTTARRQLPAIVFSCPATGVLRRHSTGHLPHGRIGGSSDASSIPTSSMYLAATRDLRHTSGRPEDRVVVASARPRSRAMSSSGPRGRNNDWVFGSWLTSREIGASTIFSTSRRYPRLKSAQDFLAPRPGL